MKTTRIALVLLLGIMLLSGFACGGGNGEGGDVVNTPDPNLEAAIREAIEKPIGDIYESDLLGLAKLYASGRDITDLNGLEYCTNLIQLSLRNNQISDISPLSGLASLTQLSLWDNQISDIEPLVNNLGLSLGDSVDLGGNPLSTISIDTYIPQLEARGVIVKYPPNHP